MKEISRKNLKEGIKRGISGLVYLTRMPIDMLMNEGRIRCPTNVHTFPSGPGCPGTVVVVCGHGKGLGFDRQNASWDIFNHNELWANNVDVRATFFNFVTCQI